MSIRYSPQMLLSRLIQTTLILACLSCVLFLFGRWFFEPQGELLRLAMFALTLTAVGVIAVSFLVAPRFDRQMARWIHPVVLRWVLTGLMSVALIAWSPSFSLAAILVLVLVGAATAPILFRWSGLKWTPTNDVTETHETLGNPIGLGGEMSEHGVSANSQQASVTNGPLLAEARTESADVQDTDLGEADPWDSIRHHVASDSTVHSNLTRWQTDSGSEALVATLRCRFLAEQQNQVIHVPFWPFFSGQPEVEAVVVSGPDAKIKVTDVQLQGLRLDVRLEKKAVTATELVMEVMIGHEESGGLQSDTRQSDDEEHSRSERAA